MFTPSTTQLSTFTIAPNAGILKTTRKRKKNIQLGRHPTRNMRVKFVPLLNGRRVSQLDESMEVDTTGIIEVETSFRQANTNSSNGSRSTEKKAAGGLASQRYSFSLRARDRNHFAVAISSRNMFCALALAAFASIIEKQDSSLMLPSTFQPIEPQTRKHAIDSPVLAEWLDAEQ